MAENVGWRWIFILAGAASALGLYLVLGTPESKSEAAAHSRFDTTGVLTFMVMMVSLQVLLTQGGRFGWLSPLTLSLAAIAVVFAVLFYRSQKSSDHGFVDFSLFENKTYLGATLSNFLLNCTAGVIVVGMALMQGATTMTAQEAGLLTLGYAVVVVSFIRLGKKLLQKYGPKKPMLWGCVSVGVAILLLMPTNVMTDTYKILAFVGFSFLGLGLAFYATPSTDAALSSLPEDKSGTGAGIFKMASTLGGSFGVAISATVFTAMSSGGESITWLEGLVAFQGRQDNLALREAAMVAFGINLVMLIAAFLSIVFTILDHEPADVD